MAFSSKQVVQGFKRGREQDIAIYKRKRYKKAFANFNPKKVSKFTKKDINKLLKNSEIIRNKLKIESAINNAKRFLEVQKEFGSFNKYMWGFVKGKQIDGKRKTLKDLPAITKEAEEFSKDLKKRGFKFLGPTVIYAHMQATGMVNDHTTDCFRYKFKTSK